MKRIAMLLMPAAVLLAAQAPAPSQGGRVPETSDGSVHMNRHVDAHVPARDGVETPRTDPEPARRRPAQDPFRGTIVPAPPPAPDAVQPKRDRRY
jgi:hypothetical protein